MLMPGEAVNVVVGKLARLVGETAETHSAGIRGYATAGRNAAEVFSVVDRTPLRWTGTADGPAGVPEPPAARRPSRDRIRGLDFGTGRDVEFDPNDAHSALLLGADGKPKSVLFPTQDQDADARYEGDVSFFSQWAAAPKSDWNQACSWVYEQARPTRENRSGSWYWTEPKPALWCKEVERSGSDLSPIIAHATQHGFSIRAEVDGSTRKVLLDGNEHGKLISKNDDCRVLLDSNPGGPVLLASCSPAQTSGYHADWAANHLIDEAELYRDIHVPRGILAFRIVPTADGDLAQLAAELEIRTNGDRIEPFASFWGSPWSW